MDTKEIVEILNILESEYPKWNAPIVTLVSRRSNDPFQTLMSTILSLRTKDRVTAEATYRLLNAGKTPRAILDIPLEKLKKLIYPVGFYNTKARNIHKICKLLIEKYDEVVPDSLDELLKFPGVGRKTANLVITLGYNRPGICVDTHVHRISNRFGYVQTKTPEQTEFVLRDKLPMEWWIKYNDILVAFGQTICRPVKPKCVDCPINQLCPKVGVK